MSKEECQAVEGRLIALIEKSIEGDAVVAAEDYPDVVEHLEECSDCRERAEGMLGLFWAEELGLIDTSVIPPGEPDLTFLDQ